MKRSGGRSKKMAIATENLKEQRRLTRIRKLAAPIHAKAQKAGLTEYQVRRDVKESLEELYGKGKSSN